MSALEMQILFIVWPLLQPVVTSDHLDSCRATWSACSWSASRLWTCLEGGCRRCFSRRWDCSCDVCLVESSFPGHEVFPAHSLSWHFPLNQLERDRKKVKKLSFLSALCDWGRADTRQIGLRACAHPDSDPDTLPPGRQIILARATAS